MRKLGLAAVIFMLLGSVQAFAGNCDYSWEHAKDGSQCGGRAADQREGGR